MIEYIYLPLILLLYWRTHRYKVLIDDPVPRNGYMYVIQTDKFPKEYFEKQRSLLATVTNIGVFMAVCGYIHLIWGWKAALLFAIFPLNVCGVAWTTGNYYMSTVLLVLATHATMAFISTKMAFLATFSLLATSMAFYSASLNSTLSSIPYIFFLLFMPYGWVHLLPFLTFLFGKRMTTGLKKRAEKHQNIGVKSFKIDPRLFLNCIKLPAYYLYLSFWPSRLGFYHQIGKNRWYFKRECLIISAIVCLVGWYLFIQVDWYMGLWWFLSIGIFSQFIIIGQFSAERYTLLANVAFCVLMAKFLPEPMFLIVASLWFYRSHMYIKIWRDNDILFRESAKAFPYAPENYNNIASRALDYHDWISAIVPLELSIKYSEGSKYQNIANLSVCYEAAGQYDKALFYINKALEQSDCPKDKRGMLLVRVNSLRQKIMNINKARKG